MRVLFVTDGVFPDVVGGIQRHSLFLIRHLAWLGLDLHVVHPGPSQTYFAEFSNVREQFVQRPQLHVPGHYLIENFIYSQRIARYIGKNTFDVGYGQGFTLWAYVRRRAMPCMVNLHGLEMFQTMSLRQTIESVPFRLIARNLARHADVVVSEGGKLTRLLTDVVGADPGRVVVLPNGVSPAYVEAGRQAGLEREHNTLLFVGRLEYNKGLAVLLEALAQLDHKDARLVVIGDGPLRARLQRRADSRVQWLGRVSDDVLLQWYHRAGVLVFPTLYEGMPTVILEAMCARLPIIATDVGAIDTMVTSENGWLLPPGDSHALAEALRQFLSLSVDEKRPLGDRSRALVEERYTWERIAQATYDVMCEVAGGS